MMHDPMLNEEEASKKASVFSHAMICELKHERRQNTQPDILTFQAFISVCLHYSMCTCYEYSTI